LIIRITAGPDHPLTLLEPDDFQRFCVEVVDVDNAHLHAMVQHHGLGRMAADNHLDIRITALTALAGPRTKDWHDRLASMLRYAASKGWMPDADHVRAHCEWVR
jgi:hypothetical protein